MWDVQATVHSSLQSSKHPGTGGSSGQAHVQERPEGPRFALNTLNSVFLACDFLCTSVDLMQVQLGEQLIKT